MGGPLGLSTLRLCLLRLGVTIGWPLLVLPSWKPTKSEIVPGFADRIASMISFMAQCEQDSRVRVPLFDGSVLEGDRHADFDNAAGRQIVGTIVDLSAAYRQLPVLTEHLWALVLVAATVSIHTVAFQPLSFSEHSRSEHIL
eukprot:1036108-Amphidinium_carterae.1